jgi:phospholipid/cholesterol/gamma-HCH transport system permease protein
MMPLLAFLGDHHALHRRRHFRLAVAADPPADLYPTLAGSDPVTDLWIALIKAPVFGFIIALAGCFQGMLVRAIARRWARAPRRGGAVDLPRDRARRHLRVFFSSVGWV